MQAFTRRLDELHLPYIFKSGLSTERINEDTLLILDTFGELKAFYSVASVCYVGCNHNVLEPLSFGKATIVSGECNSLYPSYPVYRLTQEKNLVLHAEGAEGIRDAFLESASTGESGEKMARRIREQLQTLSGAVERTLKTINLNNSPVN